MKQILAGLCIAGSVAAEGLYPIVDTAQVNCYDDRSVIEFPREGLDYSGQDAQTRINPPSYKDNGDGTVSDLVTGLMWTKDPGDKMTWDDAVDGAEDCRVGGYRDWRLPSIKELYSLINFNGIDPDPMGTDTSGLVPFIDDSVFDFEYGDVSNGERIIDSQWATSTIYESTTMGGNKTMFGVNFADGRIKGYPVKSRRGAKTYFVVYVRGNPAYGQNKFKDNGDGTVTDEATGLTWMQADSAEGMDWPSALGCAEEMDFAGYDDWRLPTAKELQSLVDYTRSPDTTDSAAMDPIFHCSEIENEAGEKDWGFYWSSTTHIGARGGNRAVYVCFGRGMGQMHGTWMDVHGAGCQRSNAKTGDVSNPPSGHGPQGDAQRVGNRVRLVRGGDVEEVKSGPKIQDQPQQRQSRPSISFRTGGQPQGGGFMARADRNQDGEVTRDEFRGPSEHFDRLDKNRDGVITEEEAPSGPPLGQRK